MPVNPTVLPMARAIGNAVAALGLTWRFIWSTPPEDRERHWGDSAGDDDWLDFPLPVSWYASSRDYTFQMIQGRRQIGRHDLRGKFGVFASFIDKGWAPRLFSLECERQGIPTAFIQEGMSLEPRRISAQEAQAHVPAVRRARRSVMRAARRIRSTVAPGMFGYVDEGMHSTCACVYGRERAAALRALGKPADRIFITGNPAFDALTARPIDPVPRSRTIVYAHQRLLEGGEGLALEMRWWKTLAEASNRIGARLIFKLHPRAGLSADDIRGFLGPLQASTDIREDGDVQDLIGSGGAFVTACSTAAYRALVEGVPIVLLEGIPFGLGVDLGRTGAALSARTTDDLPRLLQAALDDPGLRTGLQPAVDAAIERHLHQLDGKAAHRVAAALAGLVRK